MSGKKRGSLEETDPGTTQLREGCGAPASGVIEKHLITGKFYNKLWDSYTYIDFITP